MFYNLKIAIRNLRRNGLYSIINITGLTVSLVTCILITLWVYDEWSYDRFHANKDNLYLINVTLNNNFSAQYTPGALSVYAKAEIPEIKNACRINGWISFDYFRYNDRHILLNSTTNRGAAVDSSFFKMFSFKLLDEDNHKFFADDFSIILSESTAKSIFGNENPMGKAIRGSWNDDIFYVTGIMKDMPENSSIQYDYLLSFNWLKRNYVANGPFNSPDEDMARMNYLTYLELHPKSNVHRVDEKLKDIAVREMSPHLSLFGFTELPQIKLTLQPITEQHLYNADGSAGGMTQVRLFAGIAGLILVIACINYVNLVTARAGKRTKEMGVRRFLGAKWKAIVWQSLQETCVTLFISIILATALLYLLMPVYNQISGKNMVFHLFSFHVLIIYGLTFLSVLGLAGIYPSFFLASSHSSKNTRNKKPHVSFRRLLVVVQFVCSIALIVSTLVITLQMNFIRKKDLGFDKENIISFWSWNMREHLDAVKDELKKNPDITGVATASFNNMICLNFDFGVSWPGSEKSMKFSIGYVDLDFFDVMNIQLNEGQLPPESSLNNYCLLNETAIKEMQLQEPLHQTINQHNIFTNVSGIFKDFHFERLNYPIAPMILYCTKENPYQSNFYIKTTAQGTKSALASIEKVWKEYCPNLLFSYSFLDENFYRLYQTDIRMGKLLYIFAFIAIMISCLGLFGLVTYTAETKTKEIGIRKVLGASVINIVNLLSREFLILVGIAMLIAFPLAFYWLEKMLQDYAYRITIGWWMFALAGLITIVLTLLTVGWKAVKSATANPVKAIKSE